jgi:predicted kinase
MNNFFIMLVGLPSSGKSYLANKLAKEKKDTHIFSSDQYRKDLLGNINAQDNNNLVFNILHKDIKDCLCNGHNAIYDACNISYKRRKAFLEEIKNIACEKICYVMITPYGQCLYRNNARDRFVPESVIRKMYFSFTIPYYYEGWDKIMLNYSSPKLSDMLEYTPDSFIQSTLETNQYNSYHSATLGEHCRLCSKNLVLDDVNDNRKLDLLEAAKLHDCGKLFTQVFEDSKGNPTKDAHYYNHQYVGAYNSLSYEYANDPLYRSILIQWHMQPYFWEKDNNVKQMNKYKNLWGEELFNHIMLLHNADKIAH